MEDIWKGGVWAVDSNNSGFFGDVFVIDFLNVGFGNCTLVITHFHQDHVGGAKEVVENVEVETLWCNYLIPEKYRGINLVEPGEFPDGPQKLLNAINIYNYVYFTLKDRNTNICCINKDYDYQAGATGLEINALWPDLENCRKLSSYVDEVYSSNNTELLAEELAKKGRLFPLAQYLTDCNTAYEEN